MFKFLKKLFGLEVDTPTITAPYKVEAPITKVEPVVVEVVKVEPIIEVKAEEVKPAKKTAKKPRAKKAKTA